MSKKSLIGISVLTGIIFVSAGTALAAITNSKHDFKSKTWNTSGEICIVCHTPHNATTTNPTPLWNHTTTSASYTPYSSSSLNAVVGGPNDSSKACLSCHDGTVALNAFGGNTYSGSDAYINANYYLDTDLSNDHPVSFVYNDALATADGGLRKPSLDKISGGGSLNGKLIKDGMLIGDKLECGSCHDVHNNKGDAGTTSENLLLINNAGSALCLTCHIK